MHIMRYLLGHGLCAVHLYELHHESPGSCYTGATLEQYHGYVMALLWLHLVMLWLLLWLLCQPGERLCYGYHSSQERINMSAVPLSPCIFFQPLSLHLAYPGSMNREDSVNSKMIGCVSWISNTSLDTMNLVFFFFFFFNVEF